MCDFVLIPEASKKSKSLIAVKSIVIDLQRIVYSRRSHGPEEYSDPKRQRFVSSQSRVETYSVGLRPAQVLPWAGRERRDAREHAVGRTVEADRSPVGAGISIVAISR